MPPQPQPCYYCSLLTLGKPSEVRGEPPECLLPIAIVPMLLGDMAPTTFFVFFLKIIFIYLFLERGEGREKERERNIDVIKKH